MLDAQYFQATYPWDTFRDALLREPAVVWPTRDDPRGPLNQRAIIETDRYTGLQAYDYQNPYAFMSKNLLTVATLVPAYGIRGDTPLSVYHNVTATAGLLEGI